MSKKLINQIINELSFFCRIIFHGYTEEQLYFTSNHKRHTMKAFIFSKDGLNYTVASVDKASARKFLKEEYDVDIQNCFEVEESEMDKKNISMHEDNDTEKENFFVSIREIMPEEGSMLISTNDVDILDHI